MQTADFIRKWSPGSPAHALNERAGAQAHFIDLCRVLGVPEPGDPERYCFGRGLTKTGSLAGRTDGLADVWLRGPGLPRLHPRSPSPTMHPCRRRLPNR